MKKVSILIICLMISMVSVNSLYAQIEKEIGTLLIKDGRSPMVAGPDKLAFLRLDPKIPGTPLEIFSYNFKTKKEIRVKPGFDLKELPNSSVTFSRDGKEFITQGEQNGNWELYRYKLGQKDGEIITNLAKYRVDPPAKDMKILGTTSAELLSFNHMRYSPSGKRLIFTLSRMGKTAVWWHDIVTGESRQATEDRIGYLACFLPDDEQFIYSAMIQKENSKSDEDILLRSITGGILDTLCGSPAYEYGSVITVDGKYMVYVVRENNASNIFVMNLKTKKAKQITHATNGKHCIKPIWSYDGNEIYFQGMGVSDIISIYKRDFQKF